MVLLITIVCSFSLLHCRNILQFIHSTVDGHLSYFRILSITFLYMSFVEKIHVFLLGIYLGIELVSCRICTYSVLVDTARIFQSNYQFLQ